jgi:hypothetical protein
VSDNESWGGIAVGEACPGAAGPVGRLNLVREAEIEPAVVARDEAAGGAREVPRHEPKIAVRGFDGDPTVGCAPVSAEEGRRGVRRRWGLAGDRPAPPALGGVLASTRGAGRPDDRDPVTVLDAEGTVEDRVDDRGRDDAAARVRRDRDAKPVVTQERDRGDEAINRPIVAVDDRAGVLLQTPAEAVRGEGRLGQTFVTPLGRRHDRGRFVELGKAAA